MHEWSQSFSLDQLLTWEKYYVSILLLVWTDAIRLLRYITAL
jgi:hypothetical protein